MSAQPPGGRAARLRAEHEALRHGIGAHRAPRDVVVVDGPDALSYLQGQLSQDLVPLGPGDAVPSLVLEPDGKLCALVRVARLDDSRYGLEVQSGFGDAVVDRLRRFRLRTKVTLDLERWTLVSLRGDALSGPALSGAAPAVPRALGPLVLAVAGPGPAGVDLLGPDPSSVEAAVPPGAAWCSEEAWEALRIESGVPAMGSEIDERTIAAEAGLVETTVSFTKGCYTGQELVARLDARGNRVARRLCGVVVVQAGEHVPPGLVGASLWVHGRDRPAGRCTSAAWCPGVGAVAGLAYVHRSVELPARLDWAPADPADPADPAATGEPPAGAAGERLLDVVDLPLVGE